MRMLILTTEDSQPIAIFTKLVKAFYPCTEGMSKTKIEFSDGSSVVVIERFDDVLKMVERKTDE